MVLIVNSQAGKGGVAKSLPEVQAISIRGASSTRSGSTEGPGHATADRREALEDGKTFVVAVGGDGTIHEVVNGMIQDDKPIVPEAVLGVVAAGTGCDFIKTFGIPTMPGHAAAHLDGPESFPIDIGKITYQQDGETVTRYFANIAEVGIGAAVVATRRELPRLLGPTVYFFAFWLELREHRIAQVKVDLVDRVYEG